MKRNTVFIGVAIALLVIVAAGCAEKGPIKLDILYQAPTGTPAIIPTAVIGIGTFKDERGMPASVLGKRKIPADTVNDLIVLDTVAALVHDRVKDAFKARGFTVKDSAWDGTEETIKADGADFLIGGTINSLSVESVNEPFKTTIKAVVQMKIVAADAVNKKIIRTLNISSKMENEVWPYALPKVEDTLSKALSSALDQIFIDETLKGHLH